MHCFRRAACRLISSTASVSTRPTWAVASKSCRFIDFPQSSQPLFQRRWNSHDAPSQSKPASQSDPTTQDTSDVQKTEGTVRKRKSMKASKDVGEVDGSAQVEEVPGATERPSKRLQLLNKTPSPKETVFFGNLFYDVTAEDLRLQMEKYGVVEQVSIVFDNRGISRGFAYIQYDTIDSAKRAIEAMNGRVFEGRHAVVQFAQNNVNTLKRLKPVSKTIFIGNLPFEMTDRDLNELFKDIVNVIDIRVSVDRRTGQIRGFAHVEFTNVESARVAFETLSRKAPYGRKLRLDYSYTNRRADHVAEDES